MRIFVFLFVSVPGTALVYSQFYSDFIPKISKSTASVIQPKFDSLDKRFKILVLPFNKECEDMDGKYNEVGKVICRRLEDLNLEDSLNLTTYYFSEFIDLTNFNLAKADSIRKYHNADQIIYGSYSLQQCEGSKSDKICFNYHTDSSKWHLGKLQFNSHYNLINISGLEDIRNGTGQEDIDYIIYRLSGLSAFWLDKFSRTLYLFKKVKQFETDSILGVVMGECYLLLDNNRAAKKCYEKLSRIAPKNYLVWSGLAQVFFRLKDYIKAKECIEKALRINPNYDVCLANLAMVYNYLKNYKKANEYFLRAIEINPNNYQTLSSCGYFNLQVGDTLTAIGFFRKAIELNRNDVSSLDAMGRIYSNWCNYEYSIYYFKKELKIDSTNANILIGLGVAYANLNDYSNAREYFQKILELNPNNEIALFNMGNIYLSLKNYSKAKEYYLKVLNLNRKDDSIYVLLGEMNQNLRDFHNAIEYFETALKLNPNDEEVLTNLSFCYINLQVLPKAIKTSRKILALNSNSSMAYYNLAVAYSLMKNKKMSLKYLHEALLRDINLKSVARRDLGFQWLSQDKEFLVLTTSLYFQ